MHASLQPGGHSPKQVNGPTSTSQLKPGSDKNQNNGTSFPRQIKGKKRERGDHGTDSIKRECSSRTDDGDYVQHKTDCNLKSEIAKITKKGGVVDLEGVEKLVQLMQLGRMDRKLDLVSRSMLAGVMAATDKFDCLSRFVQLRGLAVLDEWLQDIHKGRIGDGNNLKDSNASVEEFLLVLLRALDKLPVNLQALKMCNIGRSVNHLRSHKNIEIQRKARSLVVTWKKRVKVEMTSIDAKSGSTQAVASWPSKSCLPEASHGGNRNSSVADVAMNSSITQHSASKTSSHGESNTKSASSSPGSMKSASSPAFGKSHPRISADCTSDTPLIREDRSSSSNQSHNYCQSSSAKDGKSSTAGLVTINKISSGSSHHRKASGFPGTSLTGRQKETSSGRSSSVHRTSALEKLSPSALTNEKAVEGPIIEGSGPKLIVKITNRVRSPAQCAIGGSLEDHSIMSCRDSSPVLSDKHHNPKDESDAYPCNVPTEMKAESWQSDDLKDVLTRSDECTESPLALPLEEQSRSTENCQKFNEGTKGNQLESGKLHKITFSPMNALIESVKYSEANSSLSLEDDVGINLLASVATGEMSSPTGSTESTPAVDEKARSKSSSKDHIAGVRSPSSHDADHASKLAGLVGSVLTEDGLYQPKHALLELSGDRKCAPSSTSVEIYARQSDAHFDSSSTDLQSTADPKEEIIEKCNEMKVTTSLALPISMEKIVDGKLGKQVDNEKAILRNVNVIGVSDCKTGQTEMISGDKVTTDHLRAEVSKVTVEGPSFNQRCEGDYKSGVNEGLNTGIHSQQKPIVAIAKHELTEGGSDEELQQTLSHQKSILENCEVNVGKADENDTKGYICQSERESLDKGMDKSVAVEGQVVSGLYSRANDLKNHRVDAIGENKEIPEHASLPENLQLESLAREGKKNRVLRESKNAGLEVNETDDCASSGAGASDLNTKIKFDLNEGFTADDGKYGQLVNMIASGSTPVHMINGAPFVINPITSALPTSITVAAAAKGPFVPPDDLLRIKGELGWKGSAATSAFRPAEPRKVPEIPSEANSTTSPDASTGKNGRTPLDIDLNVPDERVLEEMASRCSGSAVVSSSGYASNCHMVQNERTGSLPFLCSGGLDLDLNRVDVSNDNGQCSASGNHKVESPVVSIQPLGGLPTRNVRMDFDLNNGPGVDEASGEQLLMNQQGKGGISSQLPTAGLKMNNSELGNFSSWFPPANTYSTMKIPPILPDRGDHPFPIVPSGAPQRIFSSTGDTIFTRDFHRGSVLSTPAVPFPPGHFQYPGFAFTFPVGPTSYVDSSSGGRVFTPHVNSQLLGTVDAVSSQLQRPHVFSLPDGCSNWGSEGNRKWGKQALDLNAGPGAMGADGKDEMLRQFSVANSQVLVEEQARSLSISGGILKRKDPEGGRDNESFRYKQSSCQ
ncbi:BAH domain [Olea europaea subsp. europaea]|uniref:BAH domain n=1 Tax=Olea europaea subsp. europaea TaxID=158383 RepID=A0A8S0UQN8_OLEEU|nr:BAH domain [Olea europaea subsp. europaea]